MQPECRPGRYRWARYVTGLRRRCGYAVVGGYQVDYVAHDAAHLEVLGRVDPGDARVEQGAFVGRRDDPADHHRDVGPGVAQLLEDRWDQLGVGAGEDREAHHVHALVHGGARDARGREPYPLVD